MTKNESDQLKRLLLERSGDFWTARNGEFDPIAWRRYLKKINVRMIEEYDVCEVYNDQRHDTVLVENPHMRFAWMVVPKELAFKCLVLGQMPPRYSKKPAKKG